MYNDIIEHFSDKIDLDNYFNGMSFEFAKKSLTTSKSNFKFLLGNSGAGKTFLLKSIIKEMKKDDYIFLPMGIESKEKLFKLLNISDEDLRDDSFSGERKIVIIDEAQLMDIKLIEYIRTLSDTKKFNFILSTHLKDGEKILSQEHFKSREIEKIILSEISKDDLKRYLKNELMKFKLEDLISDKDLGLVYKFSVGNFRYTKKIMKKSFELLQFAVDNRIDKYKKVDKRIITMSAIDLGLVDA